MKTAEEIRATRAAAKRRYREKKVAAGLVPVTVWIPKNVADQIRGKSRIGIVAAVGNYRPCSFLATKDGLQKLQ